MSRPETITPDQLAVRYLLAGDIGACERLYARLQKHRNPDCPECGPGTPIEDNGASGADLTYLCTACGYTFNPPAI